MVVVVAVGVLSGRAVCGQHVGRMDTHHHVQPVPLQLVVGLLAEFQGVVVELERDEESEGAPPRHVVWETRVGVEGGADDQYTTRIHRLHHCTIAIHVLAAGLAQHEGHRGQLQAVPLAVVERRRRGLGELMPGQVLLGQPYLV